jgi:hypothetical protein
MQTFLTAGMEQKRVYDPDDIRLYYEESKMGIFSAAA